MQLPLEGKGQFTGNMESDPHIGRKLEKVSVDEVQINVVFESYLTGKVQKLFLKHILMKQLLMRCMAF